VAVQQLSGTSQRWLAPKKYADYSTSGLEVDVKAATNSVRLDLTWDGGAPFVEIIGK
jgi:hypothetical protein